MASEHNFSINDGIHGERPSIAPMQVGVISAFMALSMWIVIEFHVRVFRFFTRRRGLYFWSLLILAWGIILHSVGYLLNWFLPECPWQVYALMNAIGWSMMVTAESLVLYSRMHLVTRNRNVHRFVLGMIIATALFIQIPNWCISIPAVSRDLTVSEVWSPRDSIETRIQQVAFLLQESTISGLYIHYAYQLLKPNLHISERRVVWDLIFVSGFVIFLDVVVIILAFTNVHIIKEPLQNFSYALKLQLEFFVLNQLMAVSGDGFASSPSRGRGGRRSRYHVPKTASDASKTPVLEKSGTSGTSGTREMETSQSSAERMLSNDASVSNVGKEGRVPAGPWGSASSARPAVAPPLAAYLREQGSPDPAPLAHVQSLVSPMEPTSPRMAGEELVIPQVLDDRPQHAHGRIGSPLDRALPPPPPLLEVPQPAGSWLDLEGRLTDIERRLNAMG